MRLTLRTLLAWLDDTLSPAEVREIGKQVAESPYAQDLVDRIHRVTRQRRLTVPTSTGSDSTDPNLVASYLDNELDQDLVPEYEKLCLTSDVHMAEVASVHQILSLVGQKAKVPTEAKNRMYHLVRGREAVVPRQRAGQSSAAAPDSEPIGPWVTPMPPSRPWIERFGPACATVALLVLLSWSAWMSMTQPIEPTPPQHKGAAAAEPGSPPAVAAKTAPAGAVEGEKIAAEEPEKTEAMPPKPEPSGTTPDTGPKTEYPAGTIGMAEKPEGVLLRYDVEQRGWEQLVGQTPLKREDRLLGLDPFRSTLNLGSVKVDLVGETEVLLGTPMPNEVARFQLGQGRVALHGTAPALPFEVQFAGKNVLITPPAGTAAGVERISRFEPGSPDSAGSVLRVYGTEGTLALRVDGAEDSLSGPGSIVWDGSKWTEKSDRPPPAWVTDSAPTAHEALIGKQFLEYMRPNGPVIRNIMEAHDDDQKDVRRLSLRALRAVGDLSFITPDLRKAEDPTARREAIRVLRSAIAQGPDSIKALHDQLVSEYGEEDGRTIEKLLVGYSAKDAREEATYATLVQQLKAQDVAIRELALDNLRALTGRDDLEYDPDKPTGRGLSAWTDLLKNHELRAAVPVGKPEK